MTIDIDRLHQLIGAASASSDPPGAWVPREPLTPQRELLCAAVNALPELMRVFRAAEEFGKIAGLPFGDYTAEYRRARTELLAAVYAAREPGKQAG